MNYPETREAWLQAAIGHLRSHFIDCKLPLPPQVNVTCGWPSKKALSGRLGEAWPGDTSADQMPHVYISPLLYQSGEVLSVLAHELVHCALPKDTGHKKAFSKAGESIGLVGPAKQMAAGLELSAWLDSLVEDHLGLYPHSRVMAEKIAEESKKNQDKNRQVKIACSGYEGNFDSAHKIYILRGSRATLAKGIPKCPVCGAEMILEQREDENEKEEAA